jgi:glycosyl hydrolase family 57
VRWSPRPWQRSCSSQPSYFSLGNRRVSVFFRDTQLSDAIGFRYYAFDDSAFEALYMAEGSDWFWWFGEDKDSGSDYEFDDLFRTHLKNIYRGLGSKPPEELDWHIVPRVTLWTFTHQVPRVQPGDRLTIRTNCPGALTWWLDGEEPQATKMLPVGGVMAGVQRYHLTLGPFPAEAHAVHFRFRCTHPGCCVQDICCNADEHTV